MTVKTKPKKAIFLLTVLVTFFLSAIFLSSCKKSSGTKDPVAINVQAESVEFVLNPTNDKADYLYLHFNYNGVEYSVSANRVNQGNENGTLMIADTNVIASNSILSKESQVINVIAVANPASNTITLSIDNFIFVYGSGGTGLPTDVKDFNKITLSVSAATKFIVSGFSSDPNDETWANTYVTDLTGFTKLMSKVASQVNNNASFVITVSK